MKINNEKTFLNADSRKSNANSHRFNRQINLRPSALDSRKFALKYNFLASIILLFFFFFIICKDIYADTIYLKNGSQIIGRMIRQDDEKVTIKVGGEEEGVEVTFFNDEILRIDKEQVSSFITVPFGEGKQLDIPRPTFTTEPLLTEQARTQLEQRAKAREDEQISSQEKAQLENLSKIGQSDLIKKQKAFGEELVQLLDEQESDYFSKIGSIMQDTTNKTMNIINNPSALTGEGGALGGFIEDMPLQIEGIIKQLENIDPPHSFANFHRIYLDNLNLMKSVYEDMAKADISNTQSKIQEMQNKSAQLQKELENILAQKKAQISTDYPAQ